MHEALNFANKAKLCESFQMSIILLELMGGWLWDARLDYIIVYISIISLIKKCIILSLILWTIPLFFFVFNYSVSINIDFYLIPELTTFWMKHQFTNSLYSTFHF